ncbi:unnamed protein product [Paramecium pentaurelia]|uniref:Uncharacterized protein n=1 Tax=Paramecium pentaurelia TaxID=43138 RepID=A0A8S1WAK4_9CILI|nr:unnamed protein product [Paramecium pentaurelia]
MGNILMKCKDCFQFNKRKQTSQIQTHQLVNLSNNPEEETQGKINAQQISFTQDPTQSNERTISQIDEKNENEITLETISNQQLSALRSSQMNSNQNQNEQQQFMINEDCKTNPSLDSPYPLSFKEGELITLSSINNINQQEFNYYAQEAMKQFMEKIEIENNESGEYLVNGQELDLYASHQMRNKKMFLIIKFSFDLNTDITTFLNWSNDKKLFDFDLINTYNLQKLNEEEQIGEIILNRQGMIKQQYFTYLKTIRKIDEVYYIAFQSIRFEDKFEEYKKEFQEGHLTLGGLKISQKNKSSLIIKGYIDVDLGIKVGFHLTLKTIRDKVVTSITKLRELFI